MYRDDRDAIRHQVDVLSRERQQIRAENEAMRQELLAVRSGGPVVPMLHNPYTQDLRLLSPGERAALTGHDLKPFPVWATGLLNIFTFGLFPLIHFGLMHDRLPRAMANDPSAGKAIGFSFIPYFNFYWVFFNSMRLAERINLQYRLRGEAPRAPWGFMIACAVMTVIPYINILIGFPIMWTIGACLMQSSVNRLCEISQAPPELGAPPPSLPELDPYAKPPAGLIGP